MPIVNDEDWTKFVESNTDPYGKFCVDVARVVMAFLDERPAPLTAEMTHTLITEGSRRRGGGLTGFQAGCVASMVSQVHSRGEEFRRAWNNEVAIGTEGERANAQKGAVLNPALLNITVED